MKNMEEKERLDQKKYIDDFLTKQGRKILFHIYREPGICSGELARRLGIEKNSMSNAFDRLKKCEYPLLRWEQQGRQKKYFLTECGEKYTEMYICAEDWTKQYTFKNKGPGEQRSSGDGSRDLDRYLECIEDLERISKEWKFDLFEYLRDETSCTDEEKAGLMREMMQAFQRMTENDVQKDVQAALEKIDNERIKARMDQWIRRHYGLMPLWEWAEVSWESAYRFIDELFDHPLMNFKNQESWGISDAELRQIVMCMVQLVNQAAKRRADKQEFYQMLLEQECEERFGFYIAEKYRERETVNNMRRK